MHFTSKSPHGQAVKTSPSHGGIWGSIPHGGTKKNKSFGACFFIRCLQRHVINACVVCNCKRCVSPMAHCTLRVRNFVARTPEHWADASLCEQTHSFSLFHDSPWGYQKTCTISCRFYLLFIPTLSFMYVT